MIVRLSRYFLVVATIIVASVILPSLYWISFDKNVSSPFVVYSAKLNDFIVLQRTDEGVKRFDTKGNEYTMKEYEEALPIFYYRQLTMDGIMPDSLKGEPLETSLISHESFTNRMKAKDFVSPSYGMFPLIESESGRVSLTLPLDLFRINKYGIEFIDAKSNKLMREKSDLFTAEFISRGFTFPADIISGIPTTRKSSEEGYFITDNKGELFHLKMVLGEPRIRHVEMLNPIKIKYISCVDNKTREYYCYIISESNQVYLLEYDTYQLTEVAFNGYIPEKHMLSVYGNMFYKTFIVTADSYVEAFVFDKDYILCDTYKLEWNNKMQLPSGIISEIIFPFTLKMRVSTSSFIDTNFKRSNLPYAILLNVILVFVSFLMFKKRKLSYKDYALDLLIVLFSGVFGFLAINIIPNKFHD